MTQQLQPPSALDDSGDRPETRPAGGMSHGALVELFIELRPKLVGVVTARTGEPALAADIVQELFFRLERISGRLPAADDARAYLMRMAINATIDHQRVEARRSELLEGLVELFDSPEPSPEDALLLSDQMQIVDRALAELPDKAREMLFKSRVEGMTQAEIAADMGVSKSLVEKYLVKALLHCRARLLETAP
ncbi:MAG TPA: RNA polymerase sigma factor [Fontimonas sp.]